MHEYSVTKEAKFEVLFSLGHLFSGHDFQLCLEQIADQKESLLYLATLHKMKATAYASKDELREIEKACHAYEADLQKAKTALSIKAKIQDSTFTNECYCFCKVLVAS